MKISLQLTGNSIWTVSEHLLIIQLIPEFQMENLGLRFHIFRSAGQKICQSPHNSKFSVRKSSDMPERGSPDFLNNFLNLSIMY